MCCVLFGCMSVTIPVLFPVFACASNNKDMLVVGGGGGNTSFGVCNMIQCYVMVGDSLHKLCEYNTGSNVPTCIEYKDNVWTCAFDKYAMIFSVDIKFNIGAILHNPNGFRFLKFSSNVFVSGTNNGYCYIYSNTGKLLHTIFTNINDAVVDVTQTNTSSWIIACRNGTIQIYDENYQLVNVILNKSFNIRRIQVLADKDILAYCYAPRGPSSIQKDNNTLVKIGNGVISFVNLETDKIIMGYASGTTEVWRNNKLMYKSRVEHDMPVSAAAWLGDVLITVGADYSIRVHGSQIGSNRRWFMWASVVIVAVLAYFLNLA